MTNEDLWTGILNLAKYLKLSCSGLARLAGLNATTFNKSKRVNKYGQVRWPSTRSLVSVLNAANMTLSDFDKMIKNQVSKDNDKK